MREGIKKTKKEEMRGYEKIELNTRYKSDKVILYKCRNGDPSIDADTIAIRSRASHSKWVAREGKEDILDAWISLISHNLSPFTIVLKRKGKIKRFIRKLKS